MERRNEFSSTRQLSSQDKQTDTRRYPNDCCLCREKSSAARLNKRLIPRCPCRRLLKNRCPKSFVIDAEVAASCESIRRLSRRARKDKQVKSGAAISSYRSRGSILLPYWPYTGRNNSLFTHERPLSPLRLIRYISRSASSVQPN